MENETQLDELLARIARGSLSAEASKRLGNLDSLHVDRVKREAERLKRANSAPLPFVDGFGYGYWWRDDDGKYRYWAPPK